MMREYSLAGPNLLKEHFVHRPNISITKGNPATTITIESRQNLVTIEVGR